MESSLTNGQGGGYGIGPDEQWGGGHGIGPNVSLFCWGPGDSIIVTAPSAAEPERAAPANSSSRGGDNLPRMPTGGTELHEYRLHAPWGLWRHHRHVQRPFELFFAGAQNVWSENIRQTIQIGMGESQVEARRALLSDETFQYKVVPCAWLWLRLIGYSLFATLLAVRCSGQYCCVFFMFGDDATKLHCCVCTPLLAVLPTQLLAWHVHNCWPPLLTFLCICRSCMAR